MIKRIPTLSVHGRAAWAQAARWSAALALAFIACQPTQAQQHGSRSLCEPSGYVLGFFNGVWNDQVEATESMRELMGLTGASYNGERITSELFYNTSGKLSDRPDVTSFEDVAEVFMQRSAELNGVFDQRWEYFWSTVSEMGQSSSYWDSLTELLPAYEQAYESWIDAAKASLLSGLLGLYSNPPTPLDYSRHNTRIQALVTERKKLLLVAHSQGNLFVNNAYKEAVRVSDSADSVQVVHIATAAPILNGDYTTVDIDLVIGALRAKVGNTPAANLRIAFSRQDISGHTLIGTYLDDTRPARVRIQGQLEMALAQLKAPDTQGETGFFTVTLTWDGSGDVDLHTLEPRGAHVYYARRQGLSGYLDTDNVIGYGPEHYYASCEEGVLQAGLYRIGINNYRDATGRTATVQLSSAKEGELLTKSLSVGPERGNEGNSAPIAVFDVLVTHSPEGDWRVAAQ